MAETVGSYLRGIREGKGLTLEDVARLSRLSASAISKIETGQRNPGPSAIQRLALAYGLDELDLMRRAGHISRPIARRGRPPRVTIGDLERVLSELGLPTERRQWYIQGIMGELVGVQNRRPGAADESRRLVPAMA